jgi:hypothetical protein
VLEEEIRLQLPGRELFKVSIGEDSLRGNFIAVCHSVQHRQTRTLSHPNFGKLLMEVRQALNIKKLELDKEAVGKNGK